MAALRPKIGRSPDTFRSPIATIIGCARTNSRLAKIGAVEPALEAGQIELLHARRQRRQRTRVPKPQFPKLSSRRGYLVRKGGHFCYIACVDEKKTATRVDKTHVCLDGDCKKQRHLGWPRTEQHERIRFMMSPTEDTAVAARNRGTSSS